MSQEAPDVDAVIGTHWQLGGPYSPDLLRTAAEGAAELLRWANHATSSPDSGALRQVANVYSTVGELASLAARLDQLLRQLGRWADELQDNPALCHDETHSPSDVAIRDALRAATGLAVAADDAGTLGSALQRVHSALSSLYIDQAAAR